MITNLKAEDQHQHANGKGWVANTAKVDDSVYVGPYACVYGHAEITGRVRIEDLAQISGHAKLSGDVRVCGFRWIDGTFTAKTGVYQYNEKSKARAERIGQDIKYEDTI